MPKFELVPIDEALRRSASGKRAQIALGYSGYIGQVKPGQAGCLRASEGETLSAIRRRLGAASKSTGKNLVIKRSKEEIFFWARTQEPVGTGRKRGRPRKNSL